MSSDSGVDISYNMKFTNNELEIEFYNVAAREINELEGIYTGETQLIISKGIIDVIKTIDKILKEITEEISKEKSSSKQNFNEITIIFGTLSDTIKNNTLFFDVEDDSLSCLNTDQINNIIVKGS